MGYPPFILAEAPVRTEGVPDWGIDVAATNGLTYAHVGGVVAPSGSPPTIVPPGTVALTDDATNYVEHDDDGVVAVNTVGWTLGWTPMARITVADGEVTDYDDLRVMQGPSSFAAPAYAPTVGEGVTAVNLTYGYGDIRRYGASVAASAATNTAAFRAACAASVLGDGICTGWQVVIPRGVFVVQVAYSWTAESGTVWSVQELLSNLHIWGEPGSCIKMADNQTTLLSPREINILGSRGQPSNWSLRGVIWDMNEANNKSSVDAPTTWSRMNQAHVKISGGISNGAPSNAARAYDFVIENNEFINSPGTTAIGLAQTNLVGSTLGARGRIMHNKFRNIGTDTDDCSYIYGWCDDLVVDYNEFEGIADERLFALVCHEVHGANQSFSHNRVRNMMQGIWVAGNYTSRVRGIKMCGNIMEDMRVFGVDFDSFHASSLIDDVLIEKNSCHFTNQEYAPGFQKAFIHIVQSTYACTRVVVRGNTITKNAPVGLETEQALAGCIIAAAVSAGQKHDVTYEDNTQVGGTFGLILATYAAGRDLGRIRHKDNRYLGLVAAAPTWPTPYAAFYDATAGQIDTFENTNNECEGGGIYLHGTIGDYTTRHNTLRGGATYVENVLTVTTRRGTINGITFIPAFLNNVTAVTLGGGSRVGQYDLREDRVHLQATLNCLGTTFAAGALKLTLPIVSARVGLSSIGAWRVYDASGNVFYSGPVVVDGTGAVAQLQVPGGTFVGSGVPVAFADGDIISVDIDYPVA